MWGPEEMKLQFLSRWSLWQICSAYGSCSVCCILSQLWWTGVFPLAFFQEREALSPSLQLPMLGEVSGTAHSVEPQLLLQGREERDTSPAEKDFTWMHLYLTISQGCCLGELSGASYPECRGAGQIPEYSQMVKTKRWLHKLVGYTEEANRVIPKGNSTECSQPAAAWPSAAVLWGSEGWGLEVVSERKGERGYISFLLPTVAPRSQCNGAGVV